MWTVSFGTLLSVVMVFLFIILFLLLARMKPTNKEVQEIKKAGWEIVQQVDEYVKKMEVIKLEVEQKLDALHALEARIEMKAKTTSIQQKNEKTPLTQQKTKTNDSILSLFAQGLSANEIAEQLNLPQGIVEVTLNMKNMTKQAQ